MVLKTFSVGTDTGCSFHSDCLTCPLPRCRECLFPKFRERALAGITLPIILRELETLGADLAGLWQGNDVPSHEWD